MKKIILIFAGIAVVAMLGSCKKECVCKKVATNYIQDSTLVDSHPNPPNKVASDSTTTMYAAGHIYDKKECEYLNVTNDTSILTINGHLVKQNVDIECSMEKVDKKK